MLVRAAVVTIDLGGQTGDDGIKLFLVNKNVINIGMHTSSPLMEEKIC